MFTPSSYLRKHAGGESCLLPRLLLLVTSSSLCILLFCFIILILSCCTTTTSSSSETATTATPSEQQQTPQVTTAASTAVKCPGQTIRGQLMWAHSDSASFEIKQNIVLSPFFPERDIIYTAPRNGFIRAINQTTGALIWTSPNYTKQGQYVAHDIVGLVAAAYPDSSSQPSSPVKDTALCFSSWYYRSKISPGLRCVTASSHGKTQLWAWNFSGYGAATGNREIWVLHGKVFAADYNGSMACFDLNTGAQVWRNSELEQPAMQGALFGPTAYFDRSSSAAAGGGRVSSLESISLFFFKDTYGMVAVRASDGKILWNIEAGPGNRFNAGFKVDAATGLAALFHIAKKALYVVDVTSAVEPKVVFQGELGCYDSQTMPIPYLGQIVFFHCSNSPNISTGRKYTTVAINITADPVAFPTFKKRLLWNYSSDVWLLSPLTLDTTTTTTTTTTSTSSTSGAEEPPLLLCNAVTPPSVSGSTNAQVWGLDPLTGRVRFKTDLDAGFSNLRRNNYLAYNGDAIIVIEQSGAFAKVKYDCYDTSTTTTTTTTAAPTNTSQANTTVAAPPLTDPSPPPPQPRPTVPGGAVASPVASAMSLVSATPTSAVAMRRTEQVLRTATCGSGNEDVIVVPEQEGDAPLSSSSSAPFTSGGGRKLPADTADFAASPLQLSIGSEGLSMQRGLMIGNLVFVLGFFLLHGLLTWGYSTLLPSSASPSSFSNSNSTNNNRRGGKKRSRFSEAMRLLRFPGLVAVPFLILVPSTASAVTAVAIYGDGSTLDVVSVIVGGCLSLGLPSLLIYVLTYKWKMTKQQVILKDSDDSRAGEGKEGDEVRLLGSNKKKNQRDDANGEKKRSAPWFIPVVVIKVWRYLKDNSHDWNETDLVQKYGKALDSHDPYYFASVELTISVIIGLCDGVIYAATSKTLCMVTAFLGIAVFCFYGAALVFLRPHLCRLDTFVGWGTCFLTIVLGAAAIAKLLLQDGKQQQPVLEELLNVLSLLVMIVAFVGCAQHGRCVCDVSRCLGKAAAPTVEWRRRRRRQ